MGTLTSPKIAILGVCPSAVWTQGTYKANQTGTIRKGGITSQVEVTATRIMAYAVRVISMAMQEEVYSGSDQSPAWRELAIVSSVSGIIHAILTNG